MLPQKADGLRTPALVMLTAIAPACGGAREVRRAERPTLTEVVGSSTRAPVPLAPQVAVRVARVREAMRARGAEVLAERWSDFIEREGIRGFSVAIDRPQCVAFVGVSPDGVSDLDLTVVDAGGSELGRDDRADAHPYVRVCVRQPTRLHAFARATVGAGQVAVLVVVSPPLVSPPLDDAIGSVPTGLVTGPRTPRGGIGHDPAAPPAEAVVARRVDDYLARGWREVGTIGRGSLHHQELARWTLPASAGRCYLLQGGGGAGVEDLDLVVHAPGGAVIAQDLALDATPTVRMCPAVSGTHVVEVRMYGGAGEWALRALEAPTPRSTHTPRDVDAVGLARYRELVLDAESRGMDALDEPIRGAPWGALAQTTPLRVEAGRCYLVGAAADGAVASLDLWIANREGAVLASDTNERERAAVYHCAERSGELMIHVRTLNTRGTWLLQSFAPWGRS